MDNLARSTWAIPQGSSTLFAPDIGIDGQDRSQSQRGVMLVCALDTGMFRTL